MCVCAFADITYRSDMVTVLPSGQALCNLCSASYASVSSLRNHIDRKHLKPKFFQCLLCSSVITHKLDMMMHLRRRHGVKGKNQFQNFAINVPTKKSTATLRS
jgi:hypothetical protein